jgi:Ca-activated chloride channel family protein
MRFAEPQLLLALVVLPLAGLAAAWSAARRRRALERFAGGRPWVGRFTEEVSPHRRALKLLLLGLGTGAALVALARPQWGTRMEEVTRRGTDVVVVLDTSLSMATEDLAPSRLARAKHAVRALVDRLAGDRVALVTFAGKAEMLVPLTLDHAAIALFLDAVEVDEVGVPGTSIAEGLRIAARTLALDETGSDRGRSIVLVTDGEDHQGGIEAVLPELERAGLQVWAIGTGTGEGGPIPLRDERGTVSGYKKDREGRVVTSRLDEAVLEELARSTQGRYVRLTASGEEIDAVAEGLAGLEAGELGVTLRARYDERFQVPLVVALLALVVETLLGDRRRSGSGGAAAASRQEAA